MKVFEELSEKYVVFYINFRWRDVNSIEDLIEVLFEVRYGEEKRAVKEFIKGVLKEALKTGGKALERFKGIPISEGLFDILFGKAKKVENIFRYLERVFEEIRNEGYQPVFVLDEMQTVKDVINATGKSVLAGLFNFLIGMTKEKHLCHCLCATSDCLFIEEVYSNARLEGRAEYLLVDDLKKEEAFEVYEAFGVEDKKLVWDYIGGKIGDMIKLFERKKRGYSEREALERMLRDEVARLEWLDAKVFKERRDAEELWEFLKEFKEGERTISLKKNFEKLIYWIKENILFYNPLEGTVRPQSRLLWKAIKEVMSDE
jgi:AAA+ ATPase superfamily predicted ATPase